MLKILYQYLLIKRSNLFDSGYYLLHNPDVRKSDINPLIHFIKFGWQENRNPNPNFNTSFYLMNCPDVEQAKVNPLIHYIKFGMEEGRQTSPSRIPLKDSKSKAETEKHLFIDEDTFSKIPPQDTTEKTDIIICVGKDPENFYKCYDSIKQYTDPDEYILNIVVHQNDYHKIEPKILHEVNAHIHAMSIFNYAKANNMAIKETDNDVVLLNDDTEVTEGWLNKLRRDSKGVALTGAHTGKHCSGNSQMWGEGPCMLTYKPINMFCAFIPRIIINVVGLLNEEFQYYGGEDVDYSLRTLLRGFPLLISEAFVKHNKNQSFGDKKNLLMEYSRNVIFEKYGNIDPYDLREIQPTVSVICFIYKNQNLSRTQIDSFMKNNHMAHELIIVHETLSQVDRNVIINAQERFPKIILIELPKNTGIATARNIGFSTSTGYFTCFIEGFRNHNLGINKNLKFLITHPSISTLYINNHLSQNSELNEVFSLDLDDVSFLPTKFHNRQGFLFGRREVFLDIPFSKTSGSALDLDWLFRAHRRGYLIDCTSEFRKYAHKRGSSKKIEKQEETRQNKFEQIMTREKNVNSMKRMD